MNDTNIQLDYECNKCRNLEKELAREKARNAHYENEYNIELENILANATDDDDFLDGCGLQEIAKCIARKIETLHTENLALRQMMKGVCTMLAELNRDTLLGQVRETILKAAEMAQLTLAKLKGES